MVSRPASMTTAARKNSGALISLISHNETAQPTKAPGIPNHILKRRSACGLLYRSEITAAQVDTYCRITTRFARLTRLSKLKPKAAMHVKTVVMMIASEGVLKRGCGAEILRGKYLSSAT